MSDETRPVALRLPVDLVEWLDAEAKRVAAEHPGLKVTRTDVIRMHLTRAKAEQDAKARGTPPVS